MKSSKTQTPSLPRIDFRGHIAELDAIRGLGIGLVLLDHFWPKPLSSLIFSLGQMGWMAMDAFFVLSGFLITGILVDTRFRPDYFRNYYIRRSLRIFPLYYLLLLALLLLTHFSMGGHGAEHAALLRQWGSPAWFFFYLGNFRTAHVGYWPMVGAYGPLWSLQIEEQFYLLLPLAVRWMRLEQLSRLLWCMVFLSPAVRALFFLYDPKNPFPRFVLLPCHMEGLALGGLIAIRFRKGPWTIPKLPLTAVTFGLLVATSIVSIESRPMLPNELWSSPFNLLSGISLSSLACACLVLWLIVFRGSGYTRVLRIAPVAYIAQISYGIYLLHRVAERGVRWIGSAGVHLSPDGFPRFVVLVSLSLLLASASWYLVERPLVRLKDRVAPSRRPEKALSGVGVRFARPAPRVYLWHR